MKSESLEQRAKRIQNQLRAKYPGANVFDLNKNCLHFVCEVEPTNDHPQYDRAVEVIISSKPHKHLKMTQRYTVLSGTLEVFIDDKKVLLHSGDKYIIHPGEVHWAVSNDECWLEIYSEPGWTAEDHVPVNLPQN